MLRPSASWYAEDMRHGFFRGNLKPLFLLLFLVAMLPVLLNLVEKVQQYLSHAASVPANIVVDGGTVVGDPPRIWEGLSQGGELDFDKSIESIAYLSPRLRLLNIKYVRIDHVFDRPMDQTMREIRMIKDIAATPVISLSYFPPSVAPTDTAEPSNWGAWQKLVSDLIYRVSGKNGLNMTGVYYEVWNEPDGVMFGNWQIGGDKDYMTLYRNTVQATVRAANDPAVNPFKIGGPALADPNKVDWLRQFVEAVDRENLRLDFLSWHRYNRDTTVFSHDLAKVQQILAAHPRLVNTERVVSEWGSDPQANGVHMTNFDAAHFVSAVRAMLGRVNVATKFEVRDGSYAANDGTGLGVLTYHGTPKPIVLSMMYLMRMTGSQVAVSGEGSNVTGFAMKDADNVRLILANYDRYMSNTEEVPVLFTRVATGSYSLRKTVLDSHNLGGRSEDVAIDLPAGSLSTTVTMLPDSVALLELIKR